MDSIVNPGQFVVDIYNIALMLGGVLAFGAVVYGAVSYSVAAGNPSAQTEAKEWITQALVGLLLLFGAYLILFTVDNDLPSRLALPELAALPPPPTITNIPNPGCPGCQSVGQALGVQCQQPAQCGADPRVIAQLRCILSRANPTSFVVSGGFPPTQGIHDEGPQGRGCAVDILAGNNSCADVEKLIYDAKSSCAFTNIINEYPGCPTYHKTIKPSTGSHIHLEAC
jgi:hypothetical protein